MEFEVNTKITIKVNDQTFELTREEATQLYGDLARHVIPFISMIKPVNTNNILYRAPSQESFLAPSSVPFKGDITC